METITEDIEITETELDAFVAKLSRPEKDPDEITVQELAEKTGKPNKALYDILERLVQEGILVKRNVSNRNQYKPAEGKSWADAAKALD